MSNEVTQSGDAVSQEIATIERTMRDTPHEYWRDQGMQERYRGLISAREGSAPPPAAPSEVDREIASLTALMRTDRRAYERDGHDTRLLALLREREGQDEAPATAEDWRATPEQARRDLSPEVVAELERSGDFAGSLHALQDELVDLFASINEGGQLNDFTAAYEGLPERIQAAVELEFARGAPTFAARASDADIAAFAALEEGPALLEAWGSSSARKLGIACERYRRVKAGLSAADQEHLDFFVDHATATERAAIFYHLAG
jgi:hypothetical protein